ncbi:MAG: uroporphyrinogen decarboxylase [Candidatus Azotimanducaceae bacterium]|uniref:Uroporphyrinogen decarboxylase n=1 Tax=OM182 bacterium TaxID=2510334 RepID=A0A520S593_9GAMM|nr:uroporphyrinogen decarboxylase [Gammaproteobacteria bacterium]OUV68651.1 MAG: uroporphyrinogen decarboxylase [Gammaproteobacteria bacterium TMED133]RZO77652.1 MAG: uroporphyrinogen decarboxylase [OM182 bacterium]
MSSRLNNCIFLKACRGEKTDQTPIWLYRQAGRYMSEYHQVKGDTPSLQFFKNPELAAKVTCDAQRILGVDAAILFTDLLPILEPMGLVLDYLPGIGPDISNPVRNNKDIDDLRVMPASDTVDYIGATIKLVRSELPEDIPLIGFSGAPFTLAAYAIEGRGSKNYLFVKKLMFSDERAWHVMMSKITDVVIDYVSYQIDSGVQAVQLFDSWVGCLGPDAYRRFVLPHSKRLIESVAGNVPIIHFGTGNPALLPQMHEAGADVLAIDWRSSLMDVWQGLNLSAVQGNLDPLILCGDENSVVREARALMDSVAGKPGHIFNLGHGIIPETPVKNVKALIRTVQEYRAA